MIFFNVSVDVMNGRVSPCLCRQRRIAQETWLYSRRLLFLSPPDKTAIWPRSKTTSPGILDRRKHLRTVSCGSFAVRGPERSPAMCRMVFLQYSSALGMTVKRSRPHLSSGLPWIAYEAKRAAHREPRNPAHRTHGSARERGRRRVPRVMRPHLSGDCGSFGPSRCSLRSDCPAARAASSACPHTWLSSQLRDQNLQEKHQNRPFLTNPPLLQNSFKLLFSS